jgi:putative addiction module component (TIGR02574 family)
MVQPSIKLEELTAEDRLNLIGELWNSLTDDDVTFSEGKRSELHRRLHRAGSLEWNKRGELDLLHLWR